MLRKASKRCQLLGVGSTWLLQQTNSFHSSDAKVGGKRRRTIFGGQQKRAWKLIKLLHTHYHNLHVLELLRAPCCTDSAFLAVQDSSIGDLVTHSVSESVSQVTFYFCDNDKTFERLLRDF